MLRVAPCVRFVDVYGDVGVLLMSAGHDGPLWFSSFPNHLFCLAGISSPFFLLFIFYFKTLIMVHLNVVGVLYMFRPPKEPLFREAVTSQ